MEKACFEFNVHMFNFCAHTGSNTILLHYTSNYIHYNNIYHIYAMYLSLLLLPSFSLSMDGGLYGTCAAQIDDVHPGEIHVGAWRKVKQKVQR